MHLQVSSQDIEDNFFAFWPVGLSFGQAPEESDGEGKRTLNLRFCCFTTGFKNAKGVGMADDKDANSGAWSRVPTWDGSPRTWRAFRKEMSWWLAGLDLNSTKKYNLAGRWLRQGGVGRQRRKTYEPHELAFQPEVRLPSPTTANEEIVTRKALLRGSTNCFDPQRR